MLEVPTLNNEKDLIDFIKTLPYYTEEKMNKFHFVDGTNKWVAFIRNWFYEGLTQKENDALKPKQNVEKKKALIVVANVLRDWSLKHEDKIAKSAYLMNEWFE